MTTVDFRRCNNNGGRPNQNHNDYKEPNGTPKLEVGLGERRLALAARGRAEHHLVLVRVSGEALMLQAEPSIAAFARVADPREGALSHGLKLTLSDLASACGGVSVAGDPFSISI